MTTGTIDPSSPAAPNAGDPVTRTTAVLFATARDDRGRAAALLPFADATVLDRLLAQLHELGVDPVHVVARPGDEAALRGFRGDVRVHFSGGAAEDLRLLAELSRSVSGPMLVADAGFVAHRSVLAKLVADERLATGILRSGRGGSGYGVRTLRGRVLAAGSPCHAVARPGAAFLGVLKVGPGDRPALEAAAEQLASWLAGDPELSGRVDDVPSLALVGLIRSGARVGDRDPRGLFWARPSSDEAAAQAEAELAAADEERALLDAAVKSRDGFFTTFFVSPYSKYIARWAARVGLTPNQVTVVSMLIGAGAAAAFATGHRAGLVVGAILLQLSFTTDCVDGQLARYTGNFSRLGAWLDSTFDRGKEYLVFAGLAIGASRTGHPVWVLASAALIVQTTRHISDFSFADSSDEAVMDAPQPPLEETGELAGDEPLAGRVLDRWHAGNRVSVMAWARRVIAFPIGERFAVISLTAALWGPRTTFIVLLAWGGVAAVYTHTGRVLRTLSARPPVRAASLAVYRDELRVARRIGPLLADRWAWIGPPLLRLWEYSLLVLVGALAGGASRAAAFALLCALAFHHYDLVYRRRQRGTAPPPWLTAVGLGWELRPLLALLLWSVGALPAGLYALAAVLGTVFVTEAATSWRHA